MYQGHGMDADKMIDDEFHPHQSYTVIWIKRKPECLVRVANDQHHFGVLRAGDGREIGFCKREGNFSPIHKSGLSLAAGYGYTVSVPNQFRGVSTAHNG